MNRRLARWIRVLCAAAGTLGTFLPAAGAGLAQEDLSTGVTVSSTAADAGTEARTPIYLASATGVRPGAVTLTLTFPSDLLTFKKAESDFADTFGFTVGTAVKPQDGGKTTSVDVDLRYQEPGKEKLIPDGPIVRVTFDVSKTAKRNSRITLRASAVVMTADEPPKEVTPVKTYDGTIDVTGENIFACFFYMH